MGDADHPRDEHGRFTSKGGAVHNSGARRGAKDASRAAHAASEGAQTRGEHEKAAGAHKAAAQAHRAAAAAHNAAAQKDSNPITRGEHQARANRHEAQAQGHEGKAEHHAGEAKGAPEHKGIGAWVAKRLEGAGEGLEKAKEGLENAGEKAQEVEGEALHGDPLEGALKVGGALAERAAFPLAGRAKLLARAGAAVGKKEGGEEHEGKEHGE
jgi:hypothetical protein